MISALPQTTIPVLKSISYAPYLEGLERIRRCASKIDYSTIDLPCRPLTDRAVDLLVGLSLCVPIINVIIWIFTHHVGGAQSLSSPQEESLKSPWTKAIDAAQKPVQVKAPLLSVPVDAVPKKVETFSSMDKEGSSAPYEVQGKIEYFSQGIRVTSNSEFVSSTSEYDTDWQLQSMHYTDTPKKLDVRFVKDGNTITMKGHHGTEQIDKTFTMSNPSMPWIQQASQGLRPFIKGQKNEITCYAINPKNKSLGTATLKKQNERIDPKNGPCVDIEMRATGVASWLGHRFSTHSTETGNQYVERFNFSPFYTSTSIAK